LGGAVMGKDRFEGVIDKKNNEVYQNMLDHWRFHDSKSWVNPSLSITAIAERAMDQIPVAAEKKDFEFHANTINKSLLFFTLNILFLN
jgi:cholesterol oxidase